MSQQTSSHRNICRGLMAITAAAIAVLGSGIAQAAVKTWDADSATAGLQAGDGAWDSGTNWSSSGANVAWTDGDDASFTTSGTDNVTIGGTVQANLLNIGGPTVNISGGTLQIGTGGISSTNGGSAPVTINSAVSLNGSQTWASRWNTTKTIVAGNIGETVVGSKLTIGLLPSSSGGIVTLNGNNSYSGGTELTGGSVSALTLQIGSDTAVGSGTLVLSGGTLANSVAVSLANAVSVTAATTTTLDNGLANLTLNGNISGSGALTIKNASGTGNLYLGWRQQRLHGRPHPIPAQSLLQDGHCRQQRCRVCHQRHRDHGFRRRDDPPGITVLCGHLRKSHHRGQHRQLHDRGR